MGGGWHWGVGVSSAVNKNGKHTERFNLNTPPPGGNFRDLSGGGYLARNLIFNIDGKKFLRKIFLLPPFQGKLRKKIEFFNFFRGGVFRVTFPKITFFADIRGGVFSRGGGI